jgi:hypothetical protein
MSWGDTFRNDVAKLIYNGTAIANIADNAAGSPLANLFVALHTADPGQAGTQATSEANYTGYGRVNPARTSGGFTVSGNTITNTAAVTFGLCTAGSNSITHFSIGVAVSGATKIIDKAPVGPITAVFAFTATAADTLTVPISSLAVDDRVSFYPLQGVANSLPPGITEGTIYFVKTVSGNDITISTSSGGATLDVTAAGSGIAYKHSILAVSVNITPNFAIGQLSIKLN